MGGHKDAQGDGSAVSFNMGIYDKRVLFHQEKPFIMGLRMG